uniref:Putative secreted protein n=1 Tax=Anopheles marajoara TaxID=58244 RepID=A0A2M4C7J9_9DIPT
MKNHATREQSRIHALCLSVSLSRLFALLVLKCFCFACCATRAHYGVSAAVAAAGSARPTTTMHPRLPKPERESFAAAPREVGDADGDPPARQTSGCRYGRIMLLHELQRPAAAAAAAAV